MSRNTGYIESIHVHLGAEAWLDLWAGTGRASIACVIATVEDSLSLSAHKAWSAPSIRKNRGVGSREYSTTPTWTRPSIPSTLHRLLLVTKLGPHLCRTKLPQKNIFTLPQKEFGKKSDERSDEKSIRKSDQRVTEKVPKTKEKKVIELLLPTSFCGKRETSISHISYEKCSEVSPQMFGLQAPQNCLQQGIEFHQRASAGCAGTTTLKTLTSLN